MCECGCPSNWTRYKMPGPGRSFYMVILAPHCKECDEPQAVSIEHCRPGDANFEYYENEDHYDGWIPFEKWPDCMGMAIVCGPRKCEFVKAASLHLIGVSSKEIGTNDRIDEAGAEVISEEMYADCQFAPRLAK